MSKTNEGLRVFADAFAKRVYSKIFQQRECKEDDQLSVFEDLVRGIEGIYRNSSGFSFLDLLEWANGPDADGLVANGSDAEGLVANSSDAKSLVEWAVENECLVDVIIEHYGMPFHGTDLSRSIGIIEDSGRKTPTLDKFYGVDVVVATDNDLHVDVADVVTDSDTDEPY